MTVLRSMRETLLQVIFSWWFTVYKSLRTTVLDYCGKFHRLWVSPIKLPIKLVIQRIMTRLEFSVKPRLKAVLMVSVWASMLLEVCTGSGQVRPGPAKKKWIFQRAGQGLKKRNKFSKEPDQKCERRIIFRVSPGRQNYYYYYYYIMRFPISIQFALFITRTYS